MAQIAPIGPAPSQIQEIRSRSNDVVRQAIQQHLAQLQPQGQIATADQAQLSDELVEEISRSGAANLDPHGSSNVDKLIEALMGLAPQRAEQRLGPPGAPGGGGGGGTQPAEEPARKERTVNWTPKTEQGQIIGAHDPIGSVEVKEKDAQGPQNQSRSKAGNRANRAPRPGAPGPAAGGGAPAGGASPAGGAAPTEAPAPAPGTHEPDGPENDGKKDDKVELSPESQQLASQMQKQGLQVPGLDPNQHASPAGGAQNNAGEKTVAQGDVLTRCGGFSATAWVKGSGQVQEGELIRVFDKLDDMPDDLMVRFRGRSGADAAQDYENKVQAGDDPGKPLDASQLAALRQPVGKES